MYLRFGDGTVIDVPAGAKVTITDPGPKRTLSELREAIPEGTPIEDIFDNSWKKKLDRKEGARQ